MHSITGEMHISYEVNGEPRDKTVMDVIIEANHFDFFSECREERQDLKGEPITDDVCSLLIYSDLFLDSDGTKNASTWLRTGKQAKDAAVVEKFPFDLTGENNKKILTQKLAEWIDLCAERRSIQDDIAKGSIRFEFVADMEENDKASVLQALKHAMTIPECCSYSIEQNGITIGSFAIIEKKDADEGCTSEDAGVHTHVLWSGTEVEKGSFNSLMVWWEKYRFQNASLRLKP